MAPILILGDRPGPRTDPRRPLYPHTTVGSAANLIRLMGITQSEYLERTERHNVWHDGSQARSKADALRFVDSLLRVRSKLGIPRSLIIVLGGNAMSVVSQADPRISDLKFGERRDVNARLAILFLPHTSGVNRVWNDSGYKERLRQKTEAAVRDYLS